jgi:predicted 3-demethylubiquinone-9 3-methyltransferase (glyoxalase superfamily)
VDEFALVELSPRDRGSIRSEIPLGAADEFSPPASSKLEKPGTFDRDTTEGRSQEMLTITPHLWFDNQGEEAAEFYCSIFPNSRILETRRYEYTGPDGTQTVTTVVFEVLGQRVIALNAGPDFKLNEAFSFFVECDTQEEVDEYYDKLLGGGQQLPCGWLNDRYGVSWQVVPKLLDELLQDEDKERANSVMRAMLQMKKIESKVLQEAYDHPTPA